MFDSNRPSMMSAVSRRVRYWLAAAFFALVAAEAAAQQPGASELTVRTSNRPASPAVADVSAGHPLASVIEYARQEQAYLRQAVRDFTCRLVKRERIDGFLQDYQYVDMSIREEVRDGQRVVSPLSIYLHFLAPKNIAGRRVIFVNGRDEGKMLVRNGGKHFDYVVTKVDPYGDSAKAESLVPITQTGMNQILDQMVEVLKRHATADPSGDNTAVERIKGAKINQRSCHVIRITHAKKLPGLEFHVANVFVDDQMHVPSRVDYSDWPARDGQAPPLIAAYTYTNLNVTVGLTDGAFSPRRLTGSRAK
jgi:hypothetical protein